MTPPPILVLHAPGTNRDTEAAVAVELAGGDPRIVSMNDLRVGSVSMSDFGGLLLPGGFSYGDALGAGVRLALELRTWLYEELTEAVPAGATGPRDLQRVPDAGPIRPARRSRRAGADNGG